MCYNDWKYELTLEERSKNAVLPWHPPALVCTTVPRFFFLFTPDPHCYSSLPMGTLFHVVICIFGYVMILTQYSVIEQLCGVCVCVLLIHLNDIV